MSYEEDDGMKAGSSEYSMTWKTATRIATIILFSLAVILLTLTILSYFGIVETTGCT